MRFLIRLVAVLAAASVLATVWFIAAFAVAGGLRALLSTGPLGGLTIAGWAIALVAGPVAAIQLWRLRENGRRAGIILFGSGFAYYAIGLVALPSADASISQISAVATVYAVPLAVLLLPRTRRLIAAVESTATG